MSDYYDEFNKSKSKFSKNDMNNVIGNRDKLMETAGRGGLAAFFSDITTLYNMTKDYASGRYTDIPWGTMAAIGGTLLYIISPIDAIPDFIPIIGLVDDVAVLGLCLQAISLDVEKYRHWKDDN